jgi:hypothetical protein
VQFAITRVAVPRRANGPDPEPPLGVHEHESSGVGANIRSYRSQSCPVAGIIVAKHELGSASLDRMPFSEVEHRLKLIEAGRGDGPMAIAIPEKPTPAVQPDAQPVHGSQGNQADSQTPNSHENTTPTGGQRTGLFIRSPWPPSSTATG